MTCPNCLHEDGDKQSGFCSYCGALTRLSSPDGVQKHAAPAPPKSEPMSPGPLLTGRIALDAALGFMGEAVATAMLIYAAWLCLTDGSGNFLMRGVTAVACLSTAIFLFWHTKQMRERYPAFARGWRRGRDTLGVGGEHLRTLCFGLLTLAVLFPLGGLLICFGMACGPAAWIAALMIAYLFGMLTRRMSFGNNKPGGPK